MLKALVDISIRETPTSEKWINIKAGSTFEPPDHMNVKKAKARKIVADVAKDKK